MGFLGKLSLWAAIAASGAALWFYAQTLTLGVRVNDLRNQVDSERRDKEAFRVLAMALPDVARRDRALREAINAAGQRTSDACLNDPRVRALNAELRLRYPNAFAGSKPAR